MVGIRRRSKKKWRDNLREGFERYCLREIEAKDREQWKKRISVKESLGGDIPEEEKKKKKDIFL